MSKQDKLDDWQKPGHVEKILRNSARCLKCGEEIESTTKWHYVTCKCGNLSVDGGKHYIKRSVKDPTMYEETSIYENQDGSTTS